MPYDETIRQTGAQPPDIDVAALERDLRARVDGEVRFEAGDRALYATDASNYRAVPIGVVVPRSVDALAETVRVCADHKAPITHRGGGTALAGQTANTAVIIDSSKYVNRVLSVDPDRKIAVVEPGCVLDKLQDACRPHGLRFGPDPSTHSRCTLGGMIGNNSCGVHSLAYGRTVDNVEALEIITVDGERMTVSRHDDADYARIIQEGGRRAEIYRQIRRIAVDHAEEIEARYPDIPRRVSGYNLNQLLPHNGFNVARALVGTESTCVTVLRAHVNLRPEPPCNTLVVAGFRSICDAADLVPDIIKFEPVGCEGMDQRLADFMRKKKLHTSTLKLLPKGEGWLLIPFGAYTQDEARAKADALMDWLKTQAQFIDGRVYDDPKDRKSVWEARESGLGATAFVPGQARDTWPGWEDSAVAPERLGEYLRKLLDLYETYGYYASLYGHFGEGLIHTRIDFGLETPDEVRRYRAFIEDAAHLVTGLGGSLSGEHGDGQARGELLRIMFGDTLVGAMEAFKSAWDPDNRMNPGKVVHARPLDVDLRMGPRFHPPQDLDSVFAYADSDQSFARAAMRCVGVGKCRQMDSGTMCPSYRGTLEEKHATRGRAHMLQEMLQGDPLTNGWNSPAVWEALDLCLGCKACKRECPVDVDMATYKAEFAYHYFKQARRPRAAWSMGQIARWARLVGGMPWLANLPTHTPGLTGPSKWVMGVHQGRDLPRFQRTFRKAWTARARDNDARGVLTGRGRGPRVILFTDTFNNHFTPQALTATWEVLRAAGCRVEIPRRDVCCGRPLYDFGFLDQAKRQLRDILDDFHEPLSDGAYVVGLEPSCLATFCDELVNLFPHDLDAERLARRTYPLGDFLAQVVDWAPPRIGGSLRVHGHCNHKAVFGMTGEGDCLHKTGADVEMTDLGCCGMAGSFGFEHDKAAVSDTIAGHQFLPAVRQSFNDGVPFVADGFSCREQVRQHTGQSVPTLAEVLRDALKAEERL